MKEISFKKWIPLFKFANIWLFYSNISIIYYYIYLLFNTIYSTKSCCQNVALCCQNLFFCQHSKVFCCQNIFFGNNSTTKCNILQHFANMIFGVYSFNFKLFNFLNSEKRGNCCQTQTNIYMPFKEGNFYFLFTVLNLIFFNLVIFFRFIL